MVEIKMISPLEKVFPDVRPQTEKTGGVMLQNERHHFSFFLRSDENWPALFPVKLSVQAAPGLSVRLYQTVLVPVLYGGMESEDMYVLNRNRAGLYPDFLEEKDDIVLSPHKYIGFTAEVSVKGKKTFSQNACPITICVQKDGRTLCCGIYTLTVLKERLPENNLILTQWIHFDSIMHAHHVKAFSTAFYRVCRSYFETAVAYGQTMVLTPLFTFALDTAPGHRRTPFQLVGVKKEKGVWAFDFSELAHFISFAFSCGFRYIEFSHLFSQWGACHTPAIYGEENGVQKQFFGWDTDSLGEDYLSFLAAFLPALTAFVKEAGLAEKCFLHLSDEPTAEHLERYRRLSAFVRTHAPGIRLLDALSHFEYQKENLIDLAAVSIDQDKPFCDAGIPHLVYYCCMPTVRSYPNRTIPMPLHRVRILGTLLYRNDAAGFLQWGFNFYQSALSLHRIDPYRTTDADGTFPAGDAFVVYPGEKGCLPSLRLFAFYDGIKDYLALQMLEKKRGRAFVFSLLEEEGIGVGYNDYPHDPVAFEKMREKVLLLLKEEK